jgi:hypothetical protein
MDDSLLDIRSNVSKLRMSFNLCLIFSEINVDVKQSEHEDDQLRHANEGKYKWEGDRTRQS